MKIFLSNSDFIFKIEKEELLLRKTGCNRMYSFYNVFKEKAPIAEHLQTIRRINSESEEKPKPKYSNKPKRFSKQSEET